MSARKASRSAAWYAVDRLAGRFAVLIGDDGRPRRVPRTELPGPVSEGDVLRVPLDGAGVPEWAAAMADPGERRRRLDEAERRLEKLRKRDPGGDVVL